MKKIIALGASNSKKSINKTFATYVANKISDVEVSIVDLNDFELPLYGTDFETENGIPANAKKLNDLLSSVDGFVISFAEHNGSYTAVFKNTLDWLSRIDIKIWKEKPLFLLATSPGGRGGMSVLASAKQYFPHLGGNVIADFSLPSFYDNFVDNNIVNDELRQKMEQAVANFSKELV